MARSADMQGAPPRPRNGRSPPMALEDPQGALLRFVEHLLSQDHADTDAHLIAIGYELEALLSIYPGSVQLSVTSRPPSTDGSPVSPIVPHSDALPSSFLSSPAVNAPAQSESRGASKERRSSQIWQDAVFDASIFAPGDRIRYEVTLPVWEEGDVLDELDRASMPDEPPAMRVLVSLPPTYPNSAPPQLQLLGRYLGAFPIDAGLFGDITRTYITASGVPFTPGDVCVFEGLTYAQSKAREWYGARLSLGMEGERQRETDRRHGKEGRAMSDLPEGGMSRSPRASPLATPPPHESQSGETPDGAYLPRRPSPRPTFSYTRHPSSTGRDTPDSIHAAEQGTFPHFKIYVSQPIVDRKSTFLGHAIRVTDEREVPLVIHEILSDKKVARAAHPAIFAYRIAKEVGGAAGKVYAADYDDDGETAAGSRLAHLLEILELENVVVVVSRWFGGIHLGPDRFKHINQAGREALEVGGFLDAVETSKGRKR